ncbi:hypothetical protein AUJ44_03065 [Candidatus Nomurabacteria bacterium CG1_02_47_685]|uniref:Uncharacterized protein n=1 Tax=Candidatus Nomurabacteria bacterium CG1_02_47_685 TaxID=1805282 RepID=A0A1J4V878_9BACT|nr:MAG: hypothetical protein AUJ44_03065 [Candidatus Nomurabacteria bacterium CG1_02_47_685]
MKVLIKTKEMSLTTLLTSSKNKKNGLRSVSIRPTDYHETFSTKGFRYSTKWQSAEKSNYILLLKI